MTYGNNALPQRTVPSGKCGCSWSYGKYSHSPGSKQHNAYELAKKPQLGAASTEEQLLAERAIGVNIMLCTNAQFVCLNI